MSATGRLHAVVAPNSVASSSMMDQFSGPFIPLPADTTNSASGNGTIPSSLFTSITLTEELGIETSIDSISIVVPIFSGLNELPDKDNTLFSVFTKKSAIAFPENTDFLTENPFEKSGTAITPETEPADNLADNLPSSDLPEEECATTTVLALTASATCPITEV